MYTKATIINVIIMIATKTSVDIFVVRIGGEIFDILSHFIYVMWRFILLTAPYLIILVKVEVTFYQYSFLYVQKIGLLPKTSPKDDRCQPTLNHLTINIVQVCVEVV